MICSIWEGSKCPRLCDRTRMQIRNKFAIYGGDLQGTDLTVWKRLVRIKLFLKPFWHRSVCSAVSPGWWKELEFKHGVTWSGRLGIVEKVFKVDWEVFGIGGGDYLFVQTMSWAGNPSSLVSLINAISSRRILCQVVGTHAINLKFQNLRRRASKVFANAKQGYAIT